MSLWPAFPVQIEIKYIPVERGTPKAYYQGIIYRTEYREDGSAYPFVHDVREHPEKYVIEREFDIYTNRVDKLDLSTIQLPLF